MAKSFRKVYTNEAEYIHDLAKSASLYRVKGYEAAIDKDQYAYAIAGTLNKESSTFDLSKYNHMNGELGYNYLLNEFYTDKNSEQYKENKTAIEYQWQRQLNKETYDSLNGFEKAINTITGIVGNAGNELLFGTLEGLIDLFGTAVGQTDFIAKDITGYTANKQALQEFNEKYTLIDKNKILSVANEVVSGLAKLSINMIPVAGAPIYWASMAGNVAEEAAVSNPDLEWYELMGYTAAVTAVEGLTEKISGIIFGGSAIDNLVFKTSSGKAGSWLTRIGMDFISEGMEESIAEVAGTTLWNAIVAQNNGELRREYSVKDILHAGLIGGLIGSIGAGSKIISTRNQFITKDGTIVDAKFAKENKLEGYKLTKTQTLSLQERLKTVNDKLKTSEMSKLEVKYNMSQQDLKTQHADEYNQALEADKELTLELGEACLGLAKLFEKIGYDDFAKAAELATYVENKKQKLQETYEAMENRANLIRGLAKQDALLTIQLDDKIKKRFGSVAFKVDFDIDANEQAIQQNSKKYYGVNVFFGDFGQINGLNVHYGVTLDENTIVIQKGLSREMSPEKILEEVIKHELAHTLQYEDGVLSAAKIRALEKELKLSSNNIALSDAYTDTSDLVKMSEQQAEAICQKILFDQLTIDKMFVCKNESFNKVYRWLKGLKAAHESRKIRKNNKDKIRYNQINKIMNSYKKAVANNIGNDDDLEIAKNNMELSDVEYKEIRDTYLPNGTNRHYTWLKDEHTMSTYMRKKAYDTLFNNFSQEVQNIDDIDYDMIFNENYYKPEFVEMIMSRSDDDFQYNLQEYMIETFNFTINQREMCLMEIVDYNDVVSSEFLTDIEDIEQNRNELSKYKTLYDIFNNDFRKPFNRLIDYQLKDRINLLNNVKLKFEEIDSIDVKRGKYNRQTKTITIYLPKGEINTNQSLSIKDALFHECTHALADLQGLTNGTSPEYVKGSLRKLQYKDLKFLAKELLVRTSYEQALYDKELMLDLVAVGIYELCDGEFAAEAYERSLKHRGFTDIQRKAGYTLNKSGFMADSTGIHGYGRFKNIDLKTSEVEEIKNTVFDADYNTSNYVYSFKKSSDFKDVLRRLNITDFSEKSVGKTIADKLSISGEITKNDLLTAIFFDEGTSEKAKQEFIKLFIVENGNENILSFEDIKKYENFFPLLNVYYNLLKLTESNIQNKSFEDVETIREYIEDFRLREDFKDLEKDYLEILQKSYNVIGGESSDTYRERYIPYLILKNDPDTSFNDTKKMFKSLENADRRIETFYSSQIETETTGEGSKNEMIDTIKTKRETVKDLGNEIYGNDDATVKEIKTVLRNTSEQEALNDIKQKVKELENERYEAEKNYYSLNEKELKNSIEKGLKIYDVSGDTPKEIDLGDGEKYFIRGTKNKKQLAIKDGKITKIISEDIKNLTDKPEKIKIYHTTSPTFKFLSWMHEHKDIFIKQYGEDFWNKLFNKKDRILPLSKQSYVRQINTQKQKIEKIKTLSIKDSAIVNVDYSDFSPKEFEEYITRLKGIVKKHKKVLTEARAKERLKATKAPSTHAASNIVNYEISRDSDISLANKIESLFVNEKISQVQVEGEEKAYAVAGQKIIRDNTWIFNQLTPNNYLQVRQELASHDTLASRAALNTISLFVYDRRNTTFKEIRQKIIDQKAESVTASAQELGLWSGLIRNRTPVSSFTASLSNQEVDVYVDDNKMIDIIKTNIKDFGSVEERIEKLELEAKEIQEEIDVEIIDPDDYKSIEGLSKEEYDRLMKIKNEKIDTINDLSDRLVQINNELEALLSGNSLNMIDYYATQESSIDIKNKIQTEAVQEIIKNTIEKDGQLLLEYKENKKKNKSLDKYPDAFPKLSNFVKKTVNAMEQFRITAMLSSPMTWVRNYVNNQLMRGLNAATNSIERAINETAKFQKLYEHSGQYKYVTTKADKNDARQVTKNLTEKHANKVNAWLGSKSNKTDTSAVKSETKLAALEVERKTTSNPIKRAILTAQQKVYEQLETGKLGDRPMATKVTLQCMGEILVANKDKFLRDLENMYGPLDKIKKRRSLTNEQKSILEDAYNKKSAEAIFEAIALDEGMYERFMTIAASRSIEIFFKNDNWLSTALRNISDKSLTARMAINLISPFYKVGANILSMAYKYSPLNFLSAIKKLKIAQVVTTEGYEGFSTGLETAEASKSFAQASVGSALWIAGILLAALGWVDIDEDDYLGPSLNLFGFRISLSDTAPATTALSVGAVLMHTWKNKKVFDLELFMDVMYSNTLLGTVENVFKYTDESSFLSNLGTNYITSYIPAVLKLTQKVFDGKYRDKTGTGKTKMGKWLSTTWKSIIASLPGLSYTLPTKTDPYTGKASTRYGTNSWFWNMAQALIPFTTSAKKLYTSEFEKEAVSVGAETSGLSGNFTINGKDVKVTGKTKETLSKYRVKYITSELDKMKSGKRKITIEDENGKRKTTTYNKLTDEEKKKVLTSLYSEATTSTKIKYWIDAGNKYVTSNKEEYKKYKELYKSSRIIYKEKWSKSKFVEV